MVKVTSPQKFAPQTTREFRDPGLDVSPEAFGAGVGREIAQLGRAGQEVSERLLAAEERVRDRRDSIGRSGGVDEYGVFSQETELEANTRGITNAADLEAVGATHLAKRQEILENHRAAGASPDSMVTLELRLSEMGRVAVARLGVLSTEQGAAAANSSMDRAIAPLIKQAGEGTGDLDDLFKKSDIEVNEFKGSLSAINLQAKIEEKRREVGTAFVTGMLDRAAAVGSIPLLNEAEDIMNETPGLLQALGSKGQTNLRRLFFKTRTAIRDAERDTEDKILEANNEAGEEIIKSLSEAFTGGTESGVTGNQKDFLAKPGVVSELVRASQLLNVPPDEILDRVLGPSAGAATPKEQAAKATLISGAKERGKLKVRSDILSGILEKAGVPPEEAQIAAEDIESGEAVSAPFADGSEPSDDALAVTQMMVAARRLLISGLPAESSNILRQAKFLAENSPEMRRNRELDKNISLAAAREYGVPIDTPLRDVMGLIPKSAAAEARTKATASARGRGQVEAEGKISLIEQTQSVIRRLVDEFQGKGKFAGKPNPNLFGIRGSFAKVGKTALAVIGDLGLTEFVDDVADLALTGTELTLDEMFELTRSPTLSALDILENTIGIVWANVRTKTGRVPVELIRKSIKEVQLTGLRGGQQIVDRLELVFSLIGGRKKSMQRTFGLQGEDKTESGPSIPRFRVKDGKLKRVP